MLKVENGVYAVIAVYGKLLVDEKEATEAVGHGSVLVSTSGEEVCPPRADVAVLTWQPGSRQYP